MSRGAPQSRQPGAATRVLHVVTRNQPRGAESAAVTLSEALAGRGYLTRVVALAPAQGPALAGVPVLGRSPLGPRTLLRLRRAVAGADVVVAHGSRTLPAVVLATGGLSRRRVYQNIGDPLYWAGAGWRHRRVRFLLSRMWAVAALTDTSTEVLHAHFDVPEGRLRTIRNFRDGTRFRPPTPEERRVARETLRLAPSDRVVVVVGALAPEKRVELALEATGPMPGTVTLVAGDGPQRTRLEQLAVSRGWQRTRFLGSVTDVSGLLHAADLLLMTSESEGVPGVLIEAGLSGVPAVSTDVGYVSDVIAHGETGLLVGSACASEIRTAVEQVLVNRDAMGRAARARCEERFELERVVDEWARLLG